MSRQAIVIISIVVIAAATVFVVQQVITDYLNSAQATDGRPVEFVVNQNESVNSISNRLEEEGLIRSAAYFRFRVQFTGQDNDIIAGQHELNTEMTTAEIIEVLTSENAATIQETTVRFVEGWRSEQFGEALVEAGLVESVEDFMVATRSSQWNNEFEFLHTRPSGVGLEGYLFPDTYQFRVDATVDDIIRRLLVTFEERVPPEFRAAAEEQGVTFHQAMTMASIVEREAALPEERPVVASVYYNRLMAGMPLQADPTVQYDLGESGNWWPVLTGEDLEEPGQYNTYLTPSLPPGPICNPGLDSIQAAVQPDQTDYLYFVATGDGSHEFATTLEEHEENVEQYQDDSPGPEVTPPAGPEVTPASD